MHTVGFFFFFVTIIYWPRHLVYHKSDNKTFIRNRKENHNIFLLFLGPVIFLQFKRGPVIGKLENMFNTKHSPVSCKLSRTWVQEFKIYFYREHKEFETTPSKLYSNTKNRCHLSTMMKFQIEKKPSLLFAIATEIVFLNTSI